MGASPLHGNFWVIQHAEIYTECNLRQLASRPAGDKTRLYSPTSHCYLPWFAIPETVEPVVALIVRALSIREGRGTDVLTCGFKRGNARGMPAANRLPLLLLASRPESWALPCTAMHARCMAFWKPKWICACFYVLRQSENSALFSSAFFWSASPYALFPFARLIILKTFIKGKVWFHETGEGLHCFNLESWVSWPNITECKIFFLLEKSLLDCFIESAMKFCVELYKKSRIGRVEKSCVLPKLCTTQNFKFSKKTRPTLGNQLWETKFQKKIKKTATIKNRDQLQKNATKFQNSKKSGDQLWEHTTFF